MIEIDSGLEFHHVGVACTDIRNEATRLASLGYVVEGNVFTDAKQGVRGLFLAGQSPRLEVLEPLIDAPTGVLAPWLKQNIKLYHLAYRVHGLKGTIERLRGRGAKLIVPPVAAIAFDGREIAFLMLPNHLLVELIAAE